MSCVNCDNEHFLFFVIGFNSNSVFDNCGNPVAPTRRQEQCLLRLVLKVISTELIERYIKWRQRVCIMTEMIHNTTLFRWNPRSNSELFVFGRSIQKLKSPEKPSISNLNVRMHRNNYIFWRARHSSINRLGLVSRLFWLDLDPRRSWPYSYAGLDLLLTSCCSSFRDT
jgi:hypothetical protein